MWLMARLVWEQLISYRMLLLLALCLIGLATLVISFDMTNQDSSEKVWARGHLAVLTLATLAVIFLGGTQIAMGVHDRTAMFWLTRPLPRWRFVMGKFLGSCVLGWAIVLGFGLVLVALFAAIGKAPGGVYYIWLGADLLRIIVLAAMLTFLSSGLGYMASAMVGGVICLAGWFTTFLPIYAKLVGQNPTGWVLWGIYLAIPNWEHFGSGLEIACTPGYWLALTVYSLAYTWFFVVLAILLFQWRDLS